MKKIFEAIGVLSLVCLSFLFTQKTVTVVRDYDEIMIQIKEEEKKYKIEASNAKIEGNTIIPGIHGKEIDRNRSYSQMKRYGKFNTNLLVYKSISPKISLKDNYQKYIIGGNPIKKMVSFLFLIENDIDIQPIISILEKQDIKATFFIDGKWLEKNNEQFISLIKKGYTIGNLSNHRDYTDSAYAWIDTYIKKVGKQKMGFCYNEKEDENSLILCSASKNYTVRPTNIIKSDPFKEIKEIIRSGSIITLPLTQVTERELPFIINYVKSKGYQITTLEQHLSEES